MCACVDGRSNSVRVGVKGSRGTLVMRIQPSFGLLYGPPCRDEACHTIRHQKIKLPHIPPSRMTCCEARVKQIQASGVGIATYLEQLAAVCPKYLPPTDSDVVEVFSHRQHISGSSHERPHGCLASTGVAKLNATPGQPKPFSLKRSTEIVGLPRDRFMHVNEAKHSWGRTRSLAAQTMQSLEDKPA